MHGRLLIAVAAAFLLSCATPGTFTNRPEDIRYLQSLIDKQEGELTSYAALLRVKASRDGKLDDFRTEIFSRNPDQLSLYVRGFLGKSAFKAVARRDSLLFYFTDSREYFLGTFEDLAIDAMRGSDHILSAVRTLFRGSLEIPSDSLWDFHLKRQGESFTLTQIDKVHRFESILKFDSDTDEFPYIELKRLEIKSRDERFRSVYEFRKYEFNKEIPDNKFEIEMAEDSYRLSAEELVGFLTDLDR